MIVFLLQLNKESLHIKWPFGVKTNITYDETTQEVRGSKVVHGRRSARTNSWAVQTYAVVMVSVIVSKYLKTLNQYFPESIE